MDDRTDRDVSQWEAVPYLRCCFSTRHHLLTYLQAVRSEDISLRTIGIVQQSDTSRTIGVVLDALDCSRDTVLVPLEVDETKLLLVTTTDVALAVMLSNAPITLCLCPGLVGFSLRIAIVQLRY